jgi:hypothetical protein
VVISAYICLNLLVLVLAAPSMARAEPPARPAGEERVPNLLGATGLLLVPSAYLQRDRQLSAFVGGTSEFVVGGVAAGIHNRLELSVVGVDGEDGFADGSSGVLANAKLSLKKETLTLPAFSVGIIDAFDTLNQHPNWYLVASKYVIPYFVEGLTGQGLALKLHVGYGDGIYDQELFLGAELFFRAPVSGIVEYANGDFSVGGRYHGRRWSATIGLLDLQRVGGRIAYTVVLR